MVSHHRKELEELLRGIASDFRSPRDRRLFATIEQEKLREIIEYLITRNIFTGISAVTGIDERDKLAAIYHFTSTDLVLSLKTRVSKEDSVLPTITDIIPGSSFYEREIHDLFGMKFEGNPDLSPLLLPDDWPKDTHPLLKEWDTERLRKERRED